MFFIIQYKTIYINFNSHSHFKVIYYIQPKTNDTKQEKYFIIFFIPKSDY